MERPDVENIPGDLDRFLGNFFSRRGWRSEIKYDPAEDRLYLEVRLADARLSADDRFFSLVEYFARAQDSVLRQQLRPAPAGPRVRRRTAATSRGTLHSRGSSYLDDNARGNGMRRRLLLLSFRRRFLARVRAGSAALGASSFALLVGVLGLRLDVVLAVAIGALVVQAIVLWSTAARRR